MNYEILIIDYFIGLIEYGNTPTEAEERATAFADRFTSRMTAEDAEDMENTLDILSRLVKIMEV